MQTWLRKLLLGIMASIALLSLVPGTSVSKANAGYNAPQLGDTFVQAPLGVYPFAPPEGSEDPRGNPSDLFGVLPASANSSAPGYCSSSGGSTAYEAITNASFAQNPNGTWKLEVQVFIANPNGCTSGEPCESYDPSPENVNAWIDWNGDKVWEPSEQVMDAALTGYLGINYQGTMTGIAQFSPPEVITDTTWARVNLGWSADPNDPCTPSWTWGNVVDQEVSIGGPKIKEIKVAGTKDVNNPMTTYDVKLEAVLETPPDYELIKVSWSGDLKPGDGNAYTYKPDKATHGLKKIKATASFRHKPTGATIQVAKEHEFMLFFEKKGDDDGNSKPNWFDYWGKDGAVSGLTNPIVQFDSAKGAGQYGSWNPATDKVDLGAAAAEIHYPGGLNIDGTVYGNVKGIDSTSEVIGHELRHRTTNHNWNAGGAWNGKIDTDYHTPTVQYWDLLPDDYEVGFGTDKTKTDSKDLEHKKSAVYKYYGDNEFDAIVAGHGFRGVADKDWANPGSQSTPPFKTLAMMAAEVQVIETLYATSGPINETSRYSPEGVVIPDLVELTGEYTDSGVDANSDDLLEALRISVELNVTEPSYYTVIGWIEDGTGGELAWAQQTDYLNGGVQKVNLDFNGKLLHHDALQGPFTLARVEVQGGEHGDLIDFADNPYVTAIYDRTSFTPPAVKFTGTYADAAQDTNSDALYEWLNVDVEVTVRQPGSYTLVGWLYDGDGNQIPGGVASVLFDTSGVKRLAFDGQSIRWHRKNGPYVLGLVEVRDVLQNRVVALTDIYTTATAYVATQFGQPAAATIDTSSYEDQGSDVNGDGLYDYLQVQLKIDTTVPGPYHLLGILKSLDGQVLADIDLALDLPAIADTVLLNFPGGLIRTLQVDGPYQVSALSLLDESGTTIDYQALAFTTAVYSHTAFAPPLVLLTDHYRDYAQDTNSDSVLDTLKVEVGLLPGNNGVVIAQGQLTDKSGNEIAWADGNVAVTAGTPATVTLAFSGTDILAHGQDGPYLLHNLLVYHTGDASQEISVADVHVTAPYNRTTLQPKVIIGPPATVTVQVEPATLPADGASTSTVVVTVADASGNVIPNQVVQLSSSKGTVSPISAKTGINGTITADLVASTLAGSGMVTATVGGVTGNTTVTFLPGAPAEITLLVNPTQVLADGSTAISVVAVVKDQYGNSIAGQQVDFAATAGTIGTSSQTNTSGSATTELIAPRTSGTASVTASVGPIVESAQVQFVGNPVLYIPNIKSK